jgi:acetyl esterase
MENSLATDLRRYHYICDLAWANLPRHEREGRRQGYVERSANFPAKRVVDVTGTDGVFEANGRSIRFRLFTPKAGPAIRDCIIYAHGGGFVSGNLECCEGLASEFAHDLQAAVLTFDFALAPENPFPAGVEDCYQTVLFCQTNHAALGINPRCIVFAGESNGGNFGPAVALMLRDRSKPQVAGICSLNPLFNLHRWTDGTTGEGSAAFQDEMQFFTSSYLSATRDDPHGYASPLFAPSLEGLPRTFMWSAGLDPLRWEAIQFQQRLHAAGVESELRIKPGVVHGCIRARHYYDFASETYAESLDGFLFALGRRPVKQAEMQSVAEMQPVT